MFKCDECDKELSTEKGLHLHKLSVHGEGESTRPEVAKRKERIPVGVKRPNLVSKQEDGYVNRWVNDDYGRLQRFQDGGYEFIDDPDAAESTDNGTRISKIVDKKTGKRAYLMRIDKKTYDEDQEMKQERNDRIDDAIQRGTFENKLGDAGYRKDIKYEPKAT